MKIDVAASINDTRSELMVNRTIIVIDVLRATSSIVTAIDRGTAGVIPVKTVHQAKQLKREGDLLAGERFCKKIAGFDLGNSPTELLHADLEGRRIILTSTNGTRVIEKSCKAAHVLAGSFLNAEACAHAAIALGREVLIICAGTQDQFSLEDGLCAGMIVAEIRRAADTEPVLNDFAKAMYWSYLHNEHNLEDALLQCENGTRLTQLGHLEDVLYCSRTNQTSTVPSLYNQIMTPFNRTV